VIRRIFILPFIFALAAGCAKAHYENSPDLQNPSSPDQKVTTCPVRFQTSGLCLMWEWETPPTSTQNGVLIFKVVRANLLDGTAVPVDVEGAAELILWMPEMGHGSTPTKVVPVDVGSFRATEVFFIMPGKWEMKFQFKKEGALLDEAVVSLTL
jgi:hypothetical protein